jgi:hypothetical protein
MGDGSNPRSNPETANGRSRGICTSSRALPIRCFAVESLAPRYNGALVRKD